MKKYYVDLCAFDDEKSIDAEFTDFSDAEKMYNVLKNKYNIDEYIYLSFDFCPETADYSPLMKNLAFIAC